MNNILHTTFFALLACTLTYGQQLGTTAPAGGGFENDPYANFQKKTPMMYKLFQLVKNNATEIKYDLGATIGSPFETKEYTKGKVYYDNEYLGDFYYRFNAYNQEIELKKTLLPEEKMQALIQDPKVTLTANGERYVYARMFTEKGNTEDGYLKLFYEGDRYNLYKRYIVNFKEGKPAENSMVTAIPSRFTNYIEYYYKDLEKNTIKEIPHKQSRFLKLFKEANATKLKEFIKANDLDLSVQDDLIALYGSLEN